MNSSDRSQRQTGVKPPLVEPPSFSRAETLRRVGRQIRFLRQQRHLSQDEIALRTGMNQATISNYENGKRDIPLSALLRITSALEVSLGEVLKPLGLDRPEPAGDPEVLVIRESTLGRALMRLAAGEALGEGADGIPAG